MDAQSATLDAQYAALDALAQREVAIASARAMLGLPDTCDGVITMEITPVGNAPGLMFIGTDAASVKRAHCVVARFAASGQFVAAELVPLATVVALTAPGFAFAGAGKTCITDTVTISDPAARVEALRLLGRMKGDDAWAELGHGQAE